MKFTRLRISGFKSFVEPTELYIEPGLTAIVGPNGCGKSNLFDALRWVMGENRPTSVRGSEMDDVIFAGSAGRPPRNVDDNELFPDMTELPPSRPLDQATDSQMQMYSIMTLPTRMKVAHMINRIDTIRDYQEVLDVGGKLGTRAAAAWVRERIAAEL